MRTIILTIGIVLSSQALANSTFGPVYEKGQRINPNQTLLSAKDAKQRSAIINHHLGTPGCYIMCVGPKGGLYSTGNYDLHGLIRISGQYPTNSPTNKRAKRYCYPNQLSGSHSYFTYYKELCDTLLPTCNDYCNGNGDTGGFYTNPGVRP